MAALLVASGTTGNRRALPNVKFLLRQTEAAYRGQASDIAIHASEVLAARARMNKLLAKHTGQSLTVVEDAVERDSYLSSAGAKNFGIVDSVVQNRLSEGRATAQ